MKTWLFNHAPCAVCCAERNCTEVQFKCGSDTPSCIPDYQVCDGIPQCASGEDESEALCREYDVIMAITVFLVSARRKCYIGVICDPFSPFEF